MSEFLPDSIRMATHSGRPKSIASTISFGHPTDILSTETPLIVIRQCEWIRRDWFRDGTRANEPHGNTSRDNGTVFDDLDFL